MTTEEMLADVHAFDAAKARADEYLPCRRYRPHPGRRKRGPGCFGSIAG